MHNLYRRMPEPRAWFAVLIVLAIGSFLWMWHYEAARWNLVTTLWGIFAGALVAWFYLEPRSESHQLRVWLLANSPYVKLVVEHMLQQAAKTVELSFHIPKDLVVTIEHGETRAARKAAASQALQLIASRQRELDEMKKGHWVLQRGEVHAKEPPLKGRLEAVRKINEQDAALLGRIIPLQAAVSTFITSCRFFLFACPASLDRKDNYDEETVLWALEKSCADAIMLCEACSDVLCETRLLPD